LQCRQRSVRDDSARYGDACRFERRWLEHKRKKWNWIGRKYYLLAERLATILPTETVTDAKVIRNITWLVIRANPR
jgi:hypothetical protein